MDKIHKDSIYGLFFSKYDTLQYIEQRANYILELPSPLLRRGEGA